MRRSSELLGQNEGPPLAKGHSQHWKPPTLVPSYFSKPSALTENKWPYKSPRFSKLNTLHYLRTQTHARTHTVYTETVKTLDTLSH